MKRWTRILIVLLVVAVAAAVTVLVVGSAALVRHELTCVDLDIRVQKDLSFVSEQDVKDYLRNYYGPCKGVRIDSLDLDRMEKVLDRRSAIRKSQAWITPDGILHISISQREPAVRFQTPYFGYYADDRGYIFPLQKGWTPLVPVVDGNLPLCVSEGYKGELASDVEKEWMNGILELLAYMSRSRIWAENISQISVRENGDLVLCPREGQERFIFGDSSRAKEKFALIEDYYKYIKPSKEPGWYHSVNVKYPGQIICRKK